MYKSQYIIKYRVLQKEHITVTFIGGFMLYSCKEVFLEVLE